MKYCVIFGSPRKNSNTAALLKPFLARFEALGNEILYFDVNGLQIGGCRACLGCQSDLEHICCVQQDDMQPILKALEECDGLLIAAPIYVWSAPAPVKAVIDRLVYSGCKYYGSDPHGPSLFKGKRLAILTTCGYPVEKGADLFEEEMKRYCKHTGMVYAGMLCERHKNLKLPFMDEEKALHAGQFAEKLNELK